MHLCRAEVVAVGVGEFVGHDLVKEGLDGLEVGHVARGTDNGGRSDCMKTSDVLETCKGSVRCC